MSDTLDMFQTSCTQCGAPLRIARQDNNRFWRCVNFCNSPLPIPDETEFTIQQMAEDMANHGFGSSEQQGKAQANYRRIAGSLNNVDDNRYLSPREIGVLNQASAILEHLATAAEKAKIVTKRLEVEARQRRRQREHDALQLLTNRFDNRDDVYMLAVNLLVICSVNNHHAQIVKGTVARVLDGSTPNNALHRLRDHIGSCLDRQLRDLASALAAKDGDISVLYDSICQSFLKTEVEVKTANQFALDELAHAIAVNASPNVVNLRQRLRK